jgi:tetratricopeptide (TPR) repeat protein
MSRAQIYEKIYQCAKAIGDRKAAIESLKGLRECSGDDSGVAIRMAKEWHEMKEFDKAVQEYGVAIGLTADMPGLYYNRAVSLLSLGRI